MIRVKNEPTQKRPAITPKLVKSVTPPNVTPVTRREVTQDKRQRAAARQQAKRDRDRNMSFEETVAADG